MLTKIEIENFKSIQKETIELGRVNVFIGENGCGKTNILEAVGMASAASGRKLSNDELFSKGIRVTKPSITFSAFAKENTKKAVTVRCYFDNYENPYEYFLTVDDSKEILAKWAYRDSMFEDAISTMQQSYLDAGKVDPEIDSLFLKLDEHKKVLQQFNIYHLATDVLRGIGGRSFDVPGIRGENLDVLIASFSKEEFTQLFEHAQFISWLDKIILDNDGDLKLEGHNLNLGTSKLYFRDKFMSKRNNIFSAENANEGILHVLFYLALFISLRTPKLFAIDNIETALNPYLSTVLMEELVKLAKKNDKQVLIATHSPAILDGLNLHDEEMRLFAVSRNLKGHTKVERIKLKPDAQVNGHKLKLSELWTRNYLGALPQHI